LGPLEAHRAEDECGGAERPFTDDEVRRLFGGPADQRMQDLMRIGALTGARLDVIVDLKVGGCADGLFTFKAQKRETSERAVPIHPDLAEIVARRTAGKLPEDDLFPEWPAPHKAGSVREQSFKASYQFTLYGAASGSMMSSEGTEGLASTSTRGADGSLPRLSKRTSPRASLRLSSGISARG